MSKTLQDALQMKSIRRVVTGFDQAGKSIVTSDEMPPRSARMKAIPAFWMSELWAIDGKPVLPPESDFTLTMTNFVPDPGNIRVRIWSFPPDTKARLTASPAKLHKELATLYPGFENTQDPHDPGMHVTDTIDINIIISGELILKLDSGEEKRLCPGDSVVQLGTKHAWANDQAEPCIVATVMIGASRIEEMR
jgi:hypothetical protein